MEYLRGIGIDILMAIYGPERSDRSRSRARLVQNALAWYAVYVLLCKIKRKLSFDTLLNVVPGVQGAVEAVRVKFISVFFIFF